MLETDIVQVETKCAVLAASEQFNQSGPPELGHALHTAYEFRRTRFRDFLYKRMSAGKKSDLIGG